MEWASPPKGVYHVEGSAALKRGDGDKACPNAWFLASHGAVDILSHPCPYPIGTSRCQSWCCLGALHDISSGLLGQKHSSWLPWVTSLAPCQQAWCIIPDGKLEGWSIRGRILSLGPFFDLSGVTQSVVSAIGTSRNLGNDVEWEVEAFVCSRKGILLLVENMREFGRSWIIHVLRRGNTSLEHDLEVQQFLDYGLEVHNHIKIPNEKFGFWNSQRYISRIRELLDQGFPLPIWSPIHVFSFSDNRKGSANLFEREFPNLPNIGWSIGNIIEPLS